MSEVELNEARVAELMLAWDDLPPMGKLALISIYHGGGKSEMWEREYRDRGDLSGWVVEHRGTILTPEARSVIRSSLGRGL